MAFTPENSHRFNTQGYCEAADSGCPGSIVVDVTTNRAAVDCADGGCHVMERIRVAELSMDPDKIAEQPLVFDEVKVGRW
ncbi:hypothetical protein KDA14_05390 [Candidatus Saccharibacteria bacterium]|nr:hypothetical protein [Candidatus Saccharibacteria bacterium]